MPDDLEDLDKEIGQRHVVITIHDETSQLELDDGGLAPWELVGVAGWLDIVAHDGLTSNEETEDDGA